MIRSTFGNSLVAMACIATLVLCGCAPSAYRTPPVTMTSEQYAASNRKPECEELSHPDTRASCIENRDGAAVAERRRAEAAARAAEADAAEIAAAGPVKGYALLATRRYGHCADAADLLLEHEPDFGMQTVSACAKRAELELTGAVDAAITASKANPTLNAAVKSLHAYAIASLRSLANFQQSRIELRQDRAARRAGIDERATLLDLESL